MNAWVMLSVSWGHRLQFATKPPRFNGVLMSVAEGEAAQVLQNEIVVPIKDSQQGFYSCYFLIPKKVGSLRPILDLRVLNSHLEIHVHSINSESVVSVYPPRRLVCHNAYFHIEILEEISQVCSPGHRSAALSLMSTHDCSACLSDNVAMTDSNKSIVDESSRVGDWSWSDINFVTRNSSSKSVRSRTNCSSTSPFTALASVFLRALG